MASEKNPVSVSSVPENQPEVSAFTDEMATTQAAAETTTETRLDRRGRSSRLSENGGRVNLLGLRPQGETETGFSTSASTVQQAVTATTTTETGIKETALKTGMFTGRSGLFGARGDQTDDQTTSPETANSETDNQKTGDGTTPTTEEVLTTTETPVEETETAGGLLSGVVGEVVGVQSSGGLMGRMRDVRLGRN